MLMLVLMKKVTQNNNKENGLGQPSWMRCATLGGVTAGCSEIAVWTVSNERDPNLKLKCELTFLRGATTIIPLYYLAKVRAGND